MARLVASLAAVACALGLTACGGDGAEPGSLSEATLVLDFQPNAAHAGIYAALAEGYFDEEGIDLDVREPSASTDAAKLLEAGRSDFAIMDVHDITLAIARGADIGAVAPIVAHPLAAVIAGDRAAVHRPRDLEGGTVGVTGLPSDDAVLDSVLEADGANPDGVRRVTIGFDSVAALSAGRVDAATAFWNAEGVQLADLGVPTREFRTQDYGSPDFPELWLVTTDELKQDEPRLLRGTKRAIARGSIIASELPQEAVDDLLTENEDLDRDVQSRQLNALRKAGAFDRDVLLDPPPPGALIDWEVRHGILQEPIPARGFFVG